MKHSVVVSLLCLACAAPASGAVDVHVRPPAPGKAVASVPPVLLADGSVVFGVEASPGALSIRHLAGDTMTELRSVPFTETFNPYRHVELVAAGAGFVLHQYRVTVHHLGFQSFDDISVEAFPAPGGPGTVLAGCSETCTYIVCRLPRTSVAATAGAVLVVPGCRDGTPPDPTVFDLASGASKTLDTDWDGWPAIAGDFAAGGSIDDADRFTGGSVVNWRTAEVVAELPALDSLALVSDGTAFFDPQGPVDTVFRLGPGDAEPTALPVEGAVLGVANGRILTRSSRTLTVSTVAGERLASLEDVGGPVSFDGTRLAFLDQACVTVRFQVWPVGSPPPERLSPECRFPGVGRVEADRRRAEVTLRCPARHPEGCAGTIELIAPHDGQPRVFSLAPGERTTVTLGARMAPSLCERRARVRRWQVYMSVPTVFGSRVRTLRVGRHSRCTAT